VLTGDEPHTLQALSVSYALPTLSALYKLINNATIRLSQLRVPLIIITVSSLNRGLLLENSLPAKLSFISKIIRRENQRYFRENTADFISSLIHCRPSSATPSTHTNTIPHIPDTPVTLSPLDSYLFDTSATPATPDTLVTLEPVCLPNSNVSDTPTTPDTLVTLLLLNQ
jgi:hypothetical protein